MLRKYGVQIVIVMGILAVVYFVVLDKLRSERELTRRTMSINNLKAIGTAVLSFEAREGTLPARASYDTQGKALLSWRVHILPCLDQAALYKEFHLDEPWDSEHNKSLIPMMPTVFRNPSSHNGPGITSYLAVVGKGFAFEGEKGVSFFGLPRGSANTALVVEVDDDRAVEWTRPDDWEYDAANPLGGLGRAHPDGFPVVFADRHIEFLSNDLDDQTLRAKLGIDGRLSSTGE